MPVADAWVGVTRGLEGAAWGRREWKGEALLRFYAGDEDICLGGHFGS